MIDNIEDKTLTELQNELVSRSSPGAGYKQEFSRHGARWEEEEKQRLIALSETGMLDVGAFALECQRRPESVLTCMARLGLTD